jgi:citrate lyase subunit beta / citryl-CoA lyase
VSSPEPALHRSYLFAPGADESVMRKALAADADAVILDLEDSVAVDRKDAARRTITGLLEDVGATSLSSVGAPEIHVRVNRSGDAYDIADLHVAASPLVRAVRLPKAESAAMVRSASQVLSDLERDTDLPEGAIGLYPTIESARGVLECRGIAAADSRVVRLVIGQADLVADIGAAGDDGLATLVPRSMLVLASRAEGIGPPVDGAFTDLDDERGLRDALSRARALGMFGKSAVHPRQLAAINEAFSPTPAEVSRAEEIVAAAAAAARSGSGVTVLRGEMIDRAIVQRARGLLGLRRES